MSHDPAGSPRAKAFPFTGRIVRRGDGPASTANIANIITVVRILMAPLFFVLLLVDDGEMGSLRIWAAVIFVVAILTDSLDGFLARRQNLVSDFGKIVDPLADKVLTGGAFIVLSLLGELPWWVTIVILIREVGITVYRFVALSDRVIPASRGGKLKTLLQGVALTLALFPFTTWLGDWFTWVNIVVMSAAFVATVLSGLDYMRVALRHSRARA
ncbi:MULTISPECIES: CDP-diacylglycerol--glycerol-3-phosphate 3-phosphatidyltransferase [unclassified Frondihabitans]|uniref:CDP-diacylglycerol--glycerol-3-phosphate 3-phosphatidyltransferase n=1 Tax=unclassified Frondihabitans TaxID=2626248 RepID=UPI000F502F4A|nr:MULTISPECIES: CDP-diacylglycerol--glycerol-3-phosphate 3-phosphatidyltransferase [unclassified Frondihabitans]RPE76596.1 CDP-diacylglycerol--glycerol-3-phosphate 3-phosphatidyltransferase [Frondihabitans sp. PhB153]RPF05129.1 CDP-diacylglycerol--glycerol-3-phosphate 3-phosphatidyltransferase [Frondihabitans sp. PhB161]